MKVSVIHATARPKEAIETYHKWMHAAKYPPRVEYIIAFDATRKTFEAMDKAFNGHFPENLKYIVTRQKLGAVNKCNDAANLSTGYILTQSSEDIEPMHDWDDALIRAADWSKEVIVEINDGNHNHGSGLFTGMVLSRARYLKQGFFYHPKFRHIGADDYHAWLARRDGCEVIQAKHILLKHHHWHWGDKIRKKDSVDDSVQNAEEWEHAKKTFFELTGTNLK